MTAFSTSRPCVYASPEDLPMELQDYVVCVPGTDFKILKHPLWTDMLPAMTPAPIEEVIAHREAHAHSLLSDGKIASFVFTYQRAFRMDVLHDLYEEGLFDDQPQEYWDIARQVWIDAEHDEASLIWSRLLEVDLPYREGMTLPSDREKLLAMPETLTLYRGVHGWDEEDARINGEAGYSWSLSIDTARFFGKRFLQGDACPFIIEAKAPRDRVIAYLTSRGEEEIVIDSVHVDHDNAAVHAIAEWAE